MHQEQAQKMQGVRLSTPDWESLEVGSSFDNPFWHSGKPSRISQVPPEQREFIAWDGEGINRDGNGKPQSYVLFGCSTGDYITSDTHLHTFQLLEFITKMGSLHPSAFHVGFAFGYDSNMILRSLHPNSLKRMYADGGRLNLRTENARFHIRFIPGKWFSVSKYGPKYDPKKNPHDKVTVKINDIFGFFQTSFNAAYEKYVGCVPDIVSEGKAARNTFGSLDYVEKYWSTEIGMLRELADALRKRLYGAGFRITNWHGPGALASFALRQHKIKDHMKEAPDEVREAARYAYAGGRFEMFQLGRATGPIYSVDINSAYPYGIWQLPSLANGTWVHRSDKLGEGRDTRLAKFGVYRVRLVPRRTDSYLPKRAGPLFHRDKLGNISFPWILEGWYWSPEVKQLLRLAPDQYEIIEGWELINGYKGERPFGWVKEIYDRRREWKRAGIPAELGLKLCLNSIYGKMAQRVGWDEEKNRAPAHHQLEFAGWVTSNTRAMLWSVMSKLPSTDVLAVETDGLYLRSNPEDVGIHHSEELGDWEVKVYDEILYVQSGLAWLRKGDEWTCKRRGLDARTFSLDDAQNYLRTLGPRSEWNPFVGETTRFIGLGAAINSRAPLRMRHCVWETATREISPGQGGKRIHIHGQCVACKEGRTAYDATHEMSVRSLAYGNDPRSYPHKIPWEKNQGDDYAWRESQEEQRWLISK